MRPPEAIRPPRGPTVRRHATGVLLLLALAALYLAGSGVLGARRWDGFSPQAYRYVSPPPGYQNPGPPDSGKAMVSFANGQSNQAQVFTSDLQAQVLLPAGTFPPDSSGAPVVVTITPKAPPPLAGGLYATGNAYLIQASYANGSAVPEPWKQQAMLYLVFPSGPVPNGLYRVENGQQTTVSTTVDVPTLSVQGASNQGGTYVAAGTTRPGSGSAGMRSPAVIAGVALGVAGLALVTAGLLLILRRRR